MVSGDAVGVTVVRAPSVAARRAAFLLGTGGLLGAAVLASLAVGAKAIPIGDVVDAFTNYDTQNTNHLVVRELRVPRTLVGRETARGMIPAGFSPIFRDRHELAASGDLGHTIREALAESRCLIVLCSPEAARSRWTNEEIFAFRKAHPALIRGTIKTLDAPDGVLAFLREGEGERLYCVFNMSEKPAAVTLPAGFHVTASDAPGIDYEPQEGALSLAPFGAYIGIVR